MSSPACVWAETDARAARPPISRSWWRMRRCSAEMPSPVEALPCGSRSTGRTCSPDRGESGGEIDSGRGLAHPPSGWPVPEPAEDLGAAFRGARARWPRRTARRWCRLMIVKSCAGALPHFNAAQAAPTTTIWPCGSGFISGLDTAPGFPIFRGFGQFGLYILSLREHPLCTPFPSSGRGQREQLVERGEGARGDDVSRAGKTLRQSPRSAPDEFSPEISRLFGSLLAGKQPFFWWDSTR